MSGNYYKFCSSQVPSRALGEVPASPNSLFSTFVGQVLKVDKSDTVLTLTSGGCNALNLLLHGAGHVRPSIRAC